MWAPASSSSRRTASLSAASTTRSTGRPSAVVARMRTGGCDAVAVSCFWHSLLAVDAQDLVLTAAALDVLAGAGGEAV